MEIILRFLSLLFALFIGLFLIQPAYATNAIVMDQEIVSPPMGIMVTADYAVVPGFDYVLRPIPMVISANLLNHFNVYDDFYITDETLTGKYLMLESGFKEGETVLKFPYLINYRYPVR